MKINRDYISGVCDYDGGIMFDDENDVRNFFTIYEFRSMFGQCEFNQGQLDDMADFCIEQRWHMK